MYIQIKKYVNQNNIYYYSVNTTELGGYDFFIGIDPLKKKILFFSNNNFNDNPITVVDFNLSEPLLAPNTIDLKVYTRVVTKACRALINNEFPDSLDYESC